MSIKVLCLQWHLLQKWIYFYKNFNFRLNLQCQYSQQSLCWFSEIPLMTCYFQSLKLYNLHKKSSRILGRGGVSCCSWFSQALLFGEVFNSLFYFVKESYWGNIVFNVKLWWVSNWSMIYSGSRVWSSKRELKLSTNSVPTTF